MAFWHGHLNESGRLVYGAIPNGPAVTRSHVIQVTGLAPSTVDRAFKKLVSWGLLERPERGLYVRVDVDLDVLAETYQLDLREKKREYLTEQERIQFGGYRLARIAALSSNVDARLWLPVDSYSVANVLTSELVAIDDLPTWRPSGPGETLDKQVVVPGSLGAGPGDAGSAGSEQSRPVPALAESGPAGAPGRPHNGSEP